MKRSARAEQLIETARKAQKNAYCPSSRYPVGAAVEGGSGRVYPGVNVESPTLIGHICAERAAIFGAISHGERVIRAVATVSRSSLPCGSCRQLIREFGEGDVPIFSVLLKDLSTGKRRLVKTTISRLLPLDHTARNLKAR